jgi:hypothetical protein
MLVFDVVWLTAAEAQSSDSRPPSASEVDIDEPAIEARAAVGTGDGSERVRTLAILGAVLLAAGTVLAILHRRRLVASSPAGGSIAPVVPLFPGGRARADIADERPPDPGDRSEPSGRTTAIAFVEPRDAATVHESLARVGIVADEVSDAATAFAAVVRGATLLVVDAGRPHAEDLLRSVRRRIDDGWSNCAVVAYFPPWVTVDVELSPLIDGVARYPITASDLDLAVHVARSQSDDRQGIPAVVRSPQAGPVPQSF